MAVLLPGAIPRCMAEAVRGCEVAWCVRPDDQAAGAVRPARAYAWTGKGEVMPPESRAQQPQPDPSLLGSIMPGGGWYIKWGPTAPSAGKEQLVVCFGLAQDGSSVVPLVASGQGFVINATEISDDWVLDHAAQWDMATFVAVSLRIMLSYARPGDERRRAITKSRRSISSRNLRTL